jgi:SAM-dependent methyltransferase
MFHDGAKNSRQFEPDANRFEEAAMTSKSQETVVTAQFGPRAAAYVTSAVHSQGPDLEELAALVSGHGQARVLDLGCGGGHVGFHAAPHVHEVVCYDLSDDMLRAVAGEAARRGLANIVTRRGEAESLPFDDGSFDFVLSRYSAHHWRDASAGLREARRVLKAGGQVAFVDAVSPGAPLLDTYLQAVELLRDPSHVRDYSIEEWTRMAQGAGFAARLQARRRVRLDFTSWIRRMATPEVQVQAIRALQAGMAGEVARHFEIEADGSFTIDTMTLALAPA